MKSRKCICGRVAGGGSSSGLVGAYFGCGFVWTSAVDFIYVVIICKCDILSSDDALDICLISETILAVKLRFVTVGVFLGVVMGGLWEEKWWSLGAVTDKPSQTLISVAVGI